MTMPNERTRALVWAGEFLKELLDPDLNVDLPKKLRLQARSILRHYPSLEEIESLAIREGQYGAHKHPMLSAEEVRSTIIKLL